jgi:hypothetical protein
MRTRLLFSSLIVIVAMVSLAIPEQIGLAQVPTPTEQVYSRFDLLTRIAPKEYEHRPPAFQEANLIPNVGATTVDGASWGLTFLQIFGEANVQTYLLGILIMLFLIFWIRKFLIDQMKKRQVSPFEMQMRQGYKEFRENTRDFRRFRRGRR